MVRIRSKCSDDCAECTPRVVASFTTNPSNPVWDLTLYQSDGIGTPNRKWRLVERGELLEYQRGDIDENGKLVGLPNQFESHYSYDGYMELQEGCPNYCCADIYCDEVLWP